MRRKQQGSSWRAAVDWLRQHAVLTGHEKKLLAFAAVMFLLGVATKEYRERHPRPPPDEELEEEATPSPAPRPRNPPKQPLS